MKSNWFLLLLLQYIAFFCVILFELEPRVVADSNTTVIRCIDDEREALLTFKQSLVDEDGSLSSWGREDEKRDCCYWEGISCSNTTGHVNMLNLQGTFSTTGYAEGLKGTISPALLKLHELSHLYLGGNNFSGNPIPEFIGSLSKLRYLGLSSCGFEGPIPPHLGNLSRLQYLDLRGNYNLFSVGSLDWLSRLSSLTHLDLYSSNLSKSSDWFLVVGKLHSLKTLDLSYCVLPPINPSLFISHFNFSYTTSIESLSLGGNNLTSSLTFPWLFNLSKSIVHLDLFENQLQGSIPEDFEQYTVSLTSLVLSYNELGIPKFFGNMCNLKSLELFGNKLNGQLSQFIQNLSNGCMKSSLELLYLYANEITGPIPYLGEFSSLRYLDLSDNHLNGTINKSLHHMFKLKILDLSRNSLTGVISESFFSNLSKLWYLDLSANSLALKLSHDWVPPSPLNNLWLASCKLGPHFPKWLQNLNEIRTLDISDNGISTTVPDWFWESSSKFSFLNLSTNQLNGKLPDLSLRFNNIYNFLDILDISSNNFDGPIPPLPSNASFLNLSNNKFSGSISFLCSINGNKLEFLDISNNLLFGSLPDCWMQLAENLGILNLANNSFSGNIPDSIGFLQNMETLSLHSNRLTGEVPLSLKNCSNLRVMDLGNNVLHGEIPKWIGERLSNLVILSLKSNKLHGNIPFQLCLLASIQVLDLSSNNISGIIPKCFNNFTVMTQEKSSNLAITYLIRSLRESMASRYYNKVELTWKGNTYEYKSTLGLMKSLDLSNNILDGVIPEEIMDLVGLIGLNLSRNHLTGQISPNIGRLKLLDFLDLSRNHLLGGIPSSLSQISRLGFMDLSYNNLSGKIPTGTQLQSFNSSQYAGNSELCGPPLSNCSDEEPASYPSITEDKDTPENNEDQLITLGFYISLILGFFVGFWGVCGTLILNRPWRHAYFGFLTSLKDWLYATVNIAKLLRRFRN